MTVPSILLPTDDIALCLAEDADEHGWVGGAVGDQVWTGQGALQLGPGVNASNAVDDGGHGPFDPRQYRTGEVFLPLSAPLTDGLVLLARGCRFAVVGAHVVLDPTNPAGGIGCMTAAVREVSQWPE